MTEQTLETAKKLLDIIKANRQALSLLERMKSAPDNYNYKISRDGLDVYLPKESHEVILNIVKANYEDRISKLEKEFERL